MRGHSWSGFQSLLLKYSFNWPLWKGLFSLGGKGFSNISRVQPTPSVQRINFLIDIALITLTPNSFSFYQESTLAEWRGKGGGQRDGAAGNTGTGVTVLTGHDPPGEGGPQQGNLKEAGLCLAGLQCKHVSGFCPGPDTAGPFFFPRPGFRS